VSGVFAAQTQASTGQNYDACPCDVLDSLIVANRVGGYSDDLLRTAQQQFPNKAGKIELHHIEPKYLGGDPKGALAPLDAAYHQQITNEFRRLAPYGQPKPDAARLQQIMGDVYNKYPLPPGN
jgi:hypothetical protein